MVRFFMAPCLALMLFVTSTAPAASVDAPVPVRLGIPNAPNSVLAIIARDQRFFESEGLNAAYTAYVSGKRALNDGLLTGAVDLANCSDLPVAERLVEHRDVNIVATLQSVSSINSIVARRDRGIKTFADLRGRRIGTQPFSAVHYFLTRALHFHGVGAKDYTPVLMKAESLVPALLDGTVDAISMREPFVSEAVAGLGDRALVLEAPWVYPQLELLIGRPEFVRKQPETVRRVLRALIRAEEFVIDQPDQAADVLAKSLRINRAEAKTILARSINSVRLPLVLYATLERQMAWVRAQRGASGPQTSLIGILSAEALTTLRPASASAALDQPGPGGQP